jgi:hypothetical protein
MLDPIPQALSALDLVSHRGVTPTISPLMRRALGLARSAMET